MEWNPVRKSRRSDINLNDWYSLLTRRDAALPRSRAGALPSTVPLGVTTCSLSLVAPAGALAGVSPTFGTSGTFLCDERSAVRNR